MIDPITMNRLMFAASSIVFTFYGIYFMLAVICIHYLISDKRRNTILLTYTIFTVLVATLFMVSSAKAKEYTFIDLPAKIGSRVIFMRYVVLQQTAYTIKVWLADSLLLYRLWVIWDGAWLITVIPGLLFIATFATGIAGVSLIYDISKHKDLIHLGTAFHSCSITLNIIATGLIAGKLVWKRRWAKNLGFDHADDYLSMSAIFAESGALYSIFGIIFIPLSATSNPLTFVFGPLLDAAAGIAPTFILLRMALGVAVSGQNHKSNSILPVNGAKATNSTQASALAFAPPGRYSETKLSVTPRNGIRSSTFVEEGSITTSASESN